jgi:very-short-patch-repair endonuclease
MTMRRRGAGWVQLGYGIQMPSGLEGRAALVAELDAWQPLLPPSGAWTGLTALRVHELWLPDVPALMPHFVAMGSVRGEVRPIRGRLQVSRHPHPPAFTEIDGLRVVPVPDALLACARVLGLLDLVCLIDSALHLGRCTTADIRSAAGPRRKGAPALRTGLGHANGAAESLWESVLRLLHECLGVRVLPQAEVFDDFGRFLARADLLVEGTRTLHEYDGAPHREAAQHRKDLRRDRDLVNAGHTRRGYTADVLLRSPQLVRADCETALGRSIPWAGVSVWLGLVAGSLLSTSGQRAVLRKLGVPESQLDSIGRSRRKGSAD